MLKEILLKSWSEFPKALKDLKDEFEMLRRGKSAFLYRGVSSADYILESTLERSLLSRQGKLGVREYLEHIARYQHEVAALTGHTWSDLESTKGKDFYDSTENWYPDYPYMTHLRHHGFPSPLLDWSAAPYVAAYFAFSKQRSPEPKASAVTSGCVAVYVYLERTNTGKVWEEGKPHIVLLGSRVRTHERHFRQQSRYTVCVKKNSHDGWLYVPYTDVIVSEDITQDKIWKICIPYGDRLDALAELDSLNINAYTLFNTEDALMETLYNRCVPRPDDRPDMSGMTPLEMYKGV